MPYIITNTIKGRFRYWASIYYFDDERWGVEWQGLRQNAQYFIDMEHAENWLKEISAVKGQLTLEIIEIINA